MTEDGPVLGLTRRALVLIALVVIALATLVPTLNSYVSQRQQLAEARAEVARSQAAVDDMRAQVDRWEDPAYVAAQARERLLFAMPGETRYRLTDTSGRDVPMTSEQRVEAAASQGDWYDRLWTSVEGSSRLTPSDIPDPASPTEEPTP
ncbi:FtsB family cell division protein [Brachybacterium huguangmaarense]